MYSLSLSDKLFLGSGVKFSAEEERTVIELQAEFGNKWARIATYLPGRTDNDVKNFWSSRQKRLARMLHTAPNCAPPQQPSTSSTKPRNKNTSVQLHPQISYLDIPSLEAPKFSSSPDEQSIAAKPQSCPSSSIDDPKRVKMAPFAYPGPLIYEPGPFQLDYGPPDMKPTTNPDQPQSDELVFPQVPQLQPDFPMPLESQEDIVTRLGEPNFLDEFENSGGPALGPDISCLIDGFPPIDIFDHIPSPSDWS
ncbi:R2r3-myb transcription factor [Striga asiatica]|uniref:R2r3-myb transcription factor n=1 Tax=Striga asiatica TaxID=4170 RepID=A0A5A7QRC5_STRAF|nr:R2r3-myb transcription factor [Striga asiatica]